MTASRTQSPATIPQHAREISAARSGATLAVVLALIAAAFLINYWVIPDRFLVSALYIIPVVIASRRLAPRVVAAIGGLAVALTVVNSVLESQPIVMLPLQMAALIVISHFSVQLSRNIARTGALLRETEEARDRAEKTISALSDSEERYRALARAFPNGVIFVFDRTLGHVLVEGAGLDAAGFSKSALQGKTIGESLPPRLVQALEPFCRAALEGQPGSVETEHTGRAYVCDVAPLRNERGEVFAGMAILRDVTDRKRADEERARLYAEAREAVRTRDEFLSIASHELRTPANVVQVMTENLLRRARSEKNASDLLPHLRELSDSVGRLSRLTRQVLDVSQISAGRLVLSREEVDLADVVRSVAAVFRSGLERAGCELTLDLQAACGRWDRERLDQVVTNLLANAVKYGPGQPITVTLRQDSGGAVLSVRDRGIGIAREDQSRIFERFGRAASAKGYRGLGLGLWIARRIVEAHGGTIEVESEHGAGATFRVRVPLA
jgi:PAS domain S-box-containing protein